MKTMKLEYVRREVYNKICDKIDGMERGHLLNAKYNGNRLYGDVTIEYIRQTMDEDFDLEVMNMLCEVYRERNEKMKGSN